MSEFAVKMQCLYHQADTLRSAARTLQSCYEELPAIATRLADGGSFAAQIDRLDNLYRNLESESVILQDFAQGTENIAALYEKCEQANATDSEVTGPLLERIRQIPLIRWQIPGFPPKPRFTGILCKINMPESSIISALRGLG